MNNRKIRVAITHGDTNGIGYELIFKTFAVPEMLELCTPIVYGSPKIAAYHRKALDMQANFSIINTADEAQEGRINLLTCFDDEVKVDIGVSTEESAQAAVRALDRAMTDYREGLYDVLVSAPICAGNIKVGHLAFKNLANYLQTCFGEGREALTVFTNDFMRVALVGNDLSIKEAINSVTEAHIIGKATTLFQAIKRDFRITDPRIAVLSLNPKVDGDEEKNIIAPAVAKLYEAGVNAFGPYVVEDFFGTDQYNSFDAVLAMYYDQAILPFRTLTLEDGVCSIVNLPLVCTATNCGPEFSKAGRGIADESAFRQAIYLAIDTYRNRIMYDEPMANPLPKLYHERREERDKNRFNTPKQRQEKGA